MNLFLVGLTVFISLANTLTGDTANISFFIADLKVSSSKGLKVCEIQPGLPSTFRGDRFSRGGKGIVDHNFCQAITSFGLPIWYSTGIITDTGIKKMLPKLPHVHFKNNLDAIKSDPLFANLAKIGPVDPASIADYKAILIQRYMTEKDEVAVTEEFPGVLLLDKDVHFYWRDKQKMSILFETNPQLTPLKPLWNYYPKRYSKDLVDRIHKEIPSDFLVIKPRGSSRGSGVIIFPKASLAKTLSYIFGKSKKLKKDSDPAYSHWYKDTFDSFIVEEFVASDPLYVPHLNNKPYEGTLRVVFLLIYDQGVHTVKFLGGFWTLPSLSLIEKGSFTDKTKTCCQFPFYEKVDPETLKSAENILEGVLPILHKAMLDKSIR